MEKETGWQVQGLVGTKCAKLLRRFYNGKINAHCLLINLTGSKIHDLKMSFNKKECEIQWTELLALAGPSTAHL